MFHHLNLVLLCVCGTFADSYDFAQIRTLIDSTLTCLEKTPLLNENATFQVASALSVTARAYQSVENVQPETADILQGFNNRMNAFIDKSEEAYAGSIYMYIWRGSSWLDHADASFSYGKIPRNPPLRKTLSEILDWTIPTPEIESCYYDIIVDNPQSDDQRECITICEDIMSDRNLQRGISPEARAYYNGFETLLNCSNMSPAAYKDRATYFLTYVKREVDAMLRYRNQAQFDDTLFFFLNKIVYGSAWGFSEFLTEEIVAEVVGGIDCHGCVGANRDGFDKQVLTSQTLAILTSVCRMIIEQDVQNK